MVVCAVCVCSENLISDGLYRQSLLLGINIKNRYENVPVFANRLCARTLVSLLLCAQQFMPQNLNEQKCARRQQNDQNYMASIDKT